MRLPVLALLLCLPAAGRAAGAAGGLSPAAVEAASRYSQENGGLALLVLQHRHTLLEWYADKSGAGIHKIYSGTKAFWCVAALAAQADGLLKLDEPASATLPEWRDVPGKREIALRELLDFTAGLDPGFHLHADGMADRDAYALALPSVAKPGRRFIYGPGQLQVFCEVLRRKLAGRKETPFAYLTRRVLRPLGLEGVAHKEDAKGNPLLATGFQLTARQWSRFGLSLLEGAPGILPPGALGEGLHGTRPNPAFGMGLWVNSLAPGGRELNIEEELERKWWQEDWRGVCLCRAAPRDLFVSLGSMGQRLYVAPSLGLVVVRMSTDSHFSDGEFLRLLLRAD